MRLLTRTGIDWTDKYGVLADAFARAAGEAGDHRWRDRRGRRERHHALLRPAAGAAATAPSDRLTFFAFDLMYLDGYDLTKAQLIDRKAQLQALLAPVISGSSAIQYSD